MTIPKLKDAGASTRLGAIRRYLLLPAGVAVTLCLGALKAAVSAPSESGTDQAKATERSRADQHRPEWLIPLPSPEPKKPWNEFEGRYDGLEDCSDAVMKDLLGATDEQWEQIGPRLKQLKDVRRRTRSTVGVVIMGGGGFGASGGSGASSRVGGGIGSGGRAGASRHGYGGSSGSDRYRRRPPTRRRSSARERAHRPPRRSPGYVSQWKWWRPSQIGKNRQVTLGEKLCEELLDMIASRSIRPEQFEAKMVQLSAFRKQADEDIRAAREALREVVTRRQEAMLILMGHLD